METPVDSQENGIPPKDTPLMETPVDSQENGIPPKDTPLIETTYIIVGAGPAGASLACFLASHQQTGLLVSSARGTAREPRAHITNPAALECLRDIGLEDACVAQASPAECLSHTRWGRSMVGEEWARISSWGHQPERRAEYDAASPCRHVDLPQTVLEPILVKRAVDGGWSVRFETEFVKFEREGSGDGERLMVTVKDLLTGVMWKVRTKYLLGCDGGRSAVMRQLEIPMVKEPGQGLAINVLVEVDLTKHMEHRTGNLHWCFTPEIEHPPWGWTCIARMVKPWTQWMLIFVPEPGFEDFSVRPSNEECLKRALECLGDPSLDVKILDVAKWYINEIVASSYSHGSNIHCLGDAVHRHPPFNGLGSNTCTQDAFNLAWKLAYVEKGLASTRLLDTYSPERQPIGVNVVRRANQGLRDHGPVFEALGVLPKDVVERKRQHAELGAPTAAGRARRERLADAVKHTEHEFGGIGVEMNQWYDSGAVYTADEKEARRPPPEDAVLQHQITTYPGARCPHAWLNKAVPEKPISTIDLAGHGAFCLITGVGGERWSEATKMANEQLGVTVRVHSVGWGCEWRDWYGDWARRREVPEDGCIVLRPDRVVCWRSFEAPTADSAAKVCDVIKTILGLRR